MLIGCTVICQDNAVRSELPTMTLDEAYESKAQMADAVFKILSHEMQQYGILIEKCLIIDLRPDRGVIATQRPPHQL